MGLDTWLYKKTYVKNWEYMEPEALTEISVKRGGKPLEGVDIKKVIYIVEEAGQWRKANHIHNWFIENVQDGADDCKTYYVSREKIKELLDVVNEVLLASKLIEGYIVKSISYNEDGEQTPNLIKGKVIATPTVAQKLLPTTSGFFFGSTEYDQRYYQELINTKKILNDALKSDVDTEFEYHSSW